MSNTREKRDARRVSERFHISYTHALRLIRKQVYVVQHDGAVLRGLNWNEADSLD